MADYSEKLRDPRWQKKRLEVFQRDEFTCQKCRNTNSTLAVHHKYYLPKKEPWDYPLDAFLTLCENCHQSESVIQELIRAVKKNFNMVDIQILANAFTKMELLSSSETVALAYAEALSSRSIQEKLLNRVDDWEEGNSAAIQTTIANSPDATSFGEKNGIAYELKTRFFGCELGFATYSFILRVVNKSNRSFEDFFHIQAVDSDGFELACYVIGDGEPLMPGTEATFSDQQLLEEKYYRDLKEFRVKNTNY